MNVHAPCVDLLSKPGTDNRVSYRLHKPLATCQSDIRTSRTCSQSRWRCAHFYRYFDWLIVYLWWCDILFSGLTNIAIRSFWIVCTFILSTNKGRGGNIPSGLTGSPGLLAISFRKLRAWSTRSARLATSSPSIYPYYLSKPSFYSFSQPYETMYSFIKQTIIVFRTKKALSMLIR